MDKEKFEGFLWFNSQKNEMQRRLKSGQNSGVGISIPKENLRFFDTNQNLVELFFDDGSNGEVNVRKNSLKKNCPHLIDTCIGNWARKNGLWESKLYNQSVSVPVKLEIVENYRVFRVSK